MGDKAQESAGDGHHEQQQMYPPPPPYSQVGNAAPVPNAGGPYPPMPQPYPTQPGFVPASGPGATNVVISRPAFGPYPVEMDCPYCQAHIVSSTQMIPGALPWIIFAVCFVLGFLFVIPWCLCCIPFCVDSCLDVQHDCPSCQRTLGRYSRM